MATVKITDLTSDTPATGDELAFHDVSGGDTNKATIADLLNIAHTVTSNWTVSGAWTFNGDMTLGQPNQDWVVGKAGTRNGLFVQSQGGGTEAMVNFAPFDLDGTDSVGIRFIETEAGSLGDFTDAEYIEFRFVSNAYRVKANQTGTGSYYPIHIESGGNANQIVALTNGNVGIGTNSAAEQLRVAGDISLQVGGTSTGTGLLVAANDASQQAIQRDSSTARLKTNVRAVNGGIDPQDVLAIQPRRYGREDHDREYMGFIVEDFAELGFGDILGFDPEGRPASFVEFGRGISALQQIALRDHEERIRQLEESK